jgi:GxxExxY protein
MKERGIMEARLLLGHARHAMKVLGTGHRESVYHKALVTSLNRVGVLHRSEVATPIMFMGECVGMGRADLVVGDCVVEIKANTRCPQRASGQLRKYMESLARVERRGPAVLGVILNFNQATGEVEMAQDQLEEAPPKPAAIKNAVVIKRSRFFPEEGASKRKRIGSPSE